MGTHLGFRIELNAVNIAADPINAYLIKIETEDTDHTDTHPQTQLTMDHRPCLQSENVHDSLTLQLNFGGKLYITLISKRPRASSTFCSILRP